MDGAANTSKGVASRLAAFLRASPALPTAFVRRPKGRLIWLHLPDDMPTGPIRELCKILCEQFENQTCLITATNPEKWQIIEHATIVQLPIDHAGTVDEFLDHWQPDCLLWADPEFHVRILQRFGASEKPMFLINLPVLDLSRRSMRRAASSVLNQFDHAQVISAVAMERLVGLGYPAEKITQVLPISEMAWPMKDHESRRRAMSTALGPRPIWCAAHLPMAELSAISTAHHLVRKSFPTAALILVPALGEDIKEITRILTADGWRVGPDLAGTPPDGQCEIMVTDGPSELAVWYRMASVSVMGGSLNGPASCDPFEASALGSAVVCGPISFPHAGRYRQLVKGNAVVKVEDPAELAAGLVTALAPDRCAELATAAWQVGSEGVEALAKIVDLVDSVFPKKAS